MPEFVIQVQDIEASGKDFAFAIESRWADAALAGADLRLDPTVPAKLDLHASKSGADVLVRGHMTGRLLCECSRCLGDTPLPVDTEITALFQARGADFRPEPDEVELTPEDLDREFYSGDRVVLDSIIREYLILEMPMQPLCSESCQGIPIPAHVKPPADFGKEAVDPRLAALKNVKLDKKS